MRPRSSTTMLLAAFVVIAQALPPAGAARQSLTVSLADALNYYELGEHEMVERALAGARGGDPTRILPMLEKDAAAWISADGRERAARRRLVVATFALEAGYAGLDAQWEVTKPLVEWACEMLRKAGPPTEGERQWHLAALALLEGSFEPGGPHAPEAPDLVKHVNHIRARFPNEPRLELVKALLDEWDFWVARHRRVAAPGGIGSVQTDDSVAAIAIPAIQRAATIAAIRPEALLRLGYLQSALGDVDLALKSLAEAAQGNDDPTRIYLAHLFSGWAHERAGRMPEAIASFRHGLEAVKGLSAALALGVRLYAIDQRDEADAIVQSTLTAAEPDPYKAYGYGDLRRWSTIIAGLRRSFEAR